MRRAAREYLPEKKPVDGLLAPALSNEPAAIGTFSTASILALQSGAGNSAVSALLSRANTDGPASVQEDATDGEKVERGTNKEELEDFDDVSESFKIDNSEKPIEQEIKDRFTKAKTVFHGDTFDAEIRMRFTLIRWMKWVNSKDSPYRYDFKTDKWTMRDSWLSVPAREDDGQGEIRDKDVAFRPAGKSASEAILDYFKPKQGNEEYYADCTSTIVALHYRALLEAFGKDHFERNFHNATIAPAGVFVQGRKAQGAWVEPPIMNLTTAIPINEIGSIEKLIPGDWVYFESFNTYEKDHTGNSAAWAGEHSIYLGQGMFQGFGVDEDTYDGMVQKLIDNYKQGMKEGADPPKEPQRVPGKNYSITGMLPGITQVRRLKRQEE